jgi:hypothetical protein
MRAVWLKLILRWPLYTIDHDRALAGFKSRHLAFGLDARHRRCIYEPVQHIRVGAGVEVLREAV